MYDNHVADFPTNVCCDKITHNSAEIYGKNVKFTLKLGQFCPSKFFFCVNFMLPEGVQNYTNLHHNFLHLGLTPQTHVYLL